MPYRTLTIEFYQSTSPRFRFILLEAQKHKTFNHSKDIYSVTFTREESDQSYRMSQFLKGFRNKYVFIDGKEMPWDEVFHYCNCYALRKLSHDPVQYCHGDARQYPAFNPWRCIQTMMPLSSDTEWLCYGHFDLDGTFIFDKERIKHYLLANTHKFRFCPAFNTIVILKVLDLFPETVNPRVDSNWKYVKTIDRHLIIGVSIGQEKETLPIGVIPSSPNAAKNIFDKIIDKLC
ncbi:MAG: hypothetical protein HY761_09850 [Candidatus Omnitrophica bacterium]|nr:hypothetical protein [Candidatus Omnitrophota bacterium]